MHRGLLPFIIAVAMACAAFAGQAHADPNEDKALSIVQAGKSMYKDGNYELALQLFQEASGLISSPKVDFSMGLCLMKLERWSEALQIWERLRSLELLSAVHSKIDGFIASCEAHLYGSLQISNVPEGARVTLDSEEVPPQVAIHDRIAEGQHLLRVVHPDYEEWESGIRVVAGETTSLVVEAERRLERLVVSTPRVAEPTAASNDLSGRVEVRKKKGLSTTAWVLIGTGAAALVGGGLATYFLLRNGSSVAPDDDTWVVVQ